MPGRTYEYIVKKNWRAGLGLIIAILMLWPYGRLVAQPLWEKTHWSALAYSLDPLNAELSFKIGNYYFNHGAYDLVRAECYLKRAIQLNPRFTEAYYQLSRIYFLESDFTSALDSMNHVIGLNPNFDKAYYMQGLILGYKGDLVDATRSFEEYIRRAPHEWAGYNDLAWLYFQLGDFDRVLNLATQGLTVAPQNVWLLNMKGLALLNLGKNSEAKEYFDRAKQMAQKMTPSDWGMSYPGNDPAIYAEGLQRMREAIQRNEALVFDNASS